METLILTGWGWSDYACAAALALRHFGKADIRGVSTRRLPELLNEISGYKTILILGVGLTGNPELLQKGVEKLRAKGCNIRWISALPFPENLPDSLRILLNPFIDEDGVTAAVSNCFGIPYDDLLPLVREENATSELRQFRQPVAIEGAGAEGWRHVFAQLRRQRRDQMKTHLLSALPGYGFQNPPSLRRQFLIMQDMHAQCRRRMRADRQQRCRRMQGIAPALIPKGQSQMIHQIFSPRRQCRSSWAFSVRPVVSRKKRGFSAHFRPGGAVPPRDAPASQPTKQAVNAFR